MASTYEKSVKGATKVKLAAPKSKYIEHLLMATQVGAVDQVFRPLSYRLKDSTWTIVFKALIVAHIMIRDGSKDVALRYLAEQPRYFSTSHVSTAIVSEQGENIRDYSRYLQIRVQSWRELKYDYPSQRPGGGQVGRLKTLSVEKGLLRECEGVLRLAGALLKCKFFLGDLSNDITLTAFRLLVSDLLVLFQPLNEGVMNVLGHYFEMSRTDAERALRIYRQFVERTNEVIEYLSEAKSLEHAMRLQIPNAPTGLTQALEEYLNDPDFELNRRQYLEGKEKGKSGSVATANVGTSNSASQPTAAKPAQPPRPDPTNPFNALTGNTQPAAASATTQAQSTTAKPNPLIDFFASIESEQTSMFPTPQPQQQQFAPNTQVFTQNFPQTQPFAPRTSQQFVPSQSFQSYSPPGQFARPQSVPTQQFNSPQQPIAPEWTGAGFGGYTPSSAGSPVAILPTIPSTPSQTFSPTVPSAGLQVDRNVTGTNPFRASMMNPPNTATSFSTDSLSGQSSKSTNPFAAASRSQTMSPPPASLSQTQSFPSQSSFASPSHQSSFSPTFSSQTGFQQTQTQPVFQASQSQPTFTQSPIQSQPPFLQSSSTGTNPFSRSQPQLQPSRLTPQATGSNPFRQSMLPTTQSNTNTNGFPWPQ